VKERAIVFGSHRGLVGVVTEPDAPAPGPRRAVLMANVGFHHRVGPFRLYVELARSLAALGLYALRFDLSGMGDSAPRTGTLSDAERPVLDLTEAMDWLAEKLRVEQFVLVGLCSGVDSTHAAAAADPRVVGAVFIDGYTYKTAGWFIRRHLLRYLQGERWLRATRRRSRRRAARALTGRDAPGRPAQVFDREYPPRERFRADVAAMAARGAKLLYIYTGTVDRVYNGRGQLFETLGRGVPRAGIEVDLVPHADHLFATRAHKAALLERVGRWASALGGGPAARAG
jgi:dienelactone hydrolase